MNPQLLRLWTRLARAPRTLLGLAARGAWLCALASCSGTGDTATANGHGLAPTNQEPVAVAAASVTAGEAPLLVDFSASGSEDPDGEIAYLFWDFGDGSAPTAGVAATHVYRAAGEFTCTLTVTDDEGAADSAAIGISVLPPGCPEFKAGIMAGTMDFIDATETSGIAASRRNPGVLWIHNDSGDAARIFALDATGRHLGTYAIATAIARDWEDLAVAPGPVPGESYIYLGDIGDNSRSRSHVVVYRISEPEVDLHGAAATHRLEGVVKLEMTYPDGPSDAETLLVDPLTGDLLIVTKESSGSARVYRYASPHDPGRRVEMALVATLPFGTAALPGVGSATAGDISPLGNWILIRTYSRALLWLRLDAEELGAALTRPPCAVPLRWEPQGEAIGFAADGSGYFSVSEGSRRPLYFYECIVREHPVDLD